MSTGNYLACRFTNSYGADANDWYLVMLSDAGDTIWTRTHGGIGGDYAFDAAETVDSGFVVTGFLDDAIPGNDMFFGIARFTSTGEVVWSRTYGVGVAKSICTTPDNGCIAAGIISGLSIVRTDEIGDTLWTRSFSYLGFMEALSIRRVSSGGYIIVGGANGADVLLMRIDELGDTLWSRTYEGPGIETGFSVIELSDGGFVVTGFTGTTVFAIRTDPNGNPEWMNYYDTGDGVEYTESAVPTGDNCFVIAASSSEFGTDDRNIKLLKIDQEGNTVWLQPYGSSAAENTKAICCTDDGGYLVGADIPTPDTGGDILFLRISCSELSFASNLNIGVTADPIVQHQPTIIWIYEDPCGQPQQFSELAVGTDSDWQFSEMWNPTPFASADTFVVYSGAPLVDGATYWLRLGWVRE